MRLVFTKSVQACASPALTGTGISARSNTPPTPVRAAPRLKRGVPAAPVHGDGGRGPGHAAGRRIYYERVHCLLALASVARRTNLASSRLDEPPAEAERYLGRFLGQAFHQGCPIADAALATGLPPDRVVAIGKRTIRRAKWLSRLTAGNLATLNQVFEDDG